MTFRRAATRYLEENQHKVSIGKDARALELVDPFIGALEVKMVHAGTSPRSSSLADGSG